MNPELVSLDQELASLELRVLEVKRRRNALVPIASLPPELLCQIMLACLHTSGQWTGEDDGDYQRRPTGSGGNVQCFRLSQVSSAWRAVALDTQALWSRVSICNRTKGKLTQLMFERAESAPLTLECNDETLLHYGVMPGVLTEDTIAQVANLALRVRGKPVPPVRTTMGGGLGRLIAPNLVELELEGVRIPWETPLFRSSPHLTHLTVHHSVDSTQGAMRHLIGSLRCCSLLQYLDLSLDSLPPRGALPPPVDAGDWGQLVATLRHLTELRLYFMSVAAVSTLVSHLRLSSTIVQTVNLQHYRPQGMDPTAVSFTPLLLALGKAFQGEGNALSPDALEFPDNTTVIARSTRVSGSRAAVPQKIFIQSTTCGIITSPEQITLAMSLHRLKTFSASRGTPSAIWASLRTLSNLEQIEIHAGGWKGFLEGCYNPKEPDSRKSRTRLVYARGIGMHYDTAFDSEQVFPALRDVRVLATARILEEQYWRDTMDVSVDAMVQPFVKIMQARLGSRRHVSSGRQGLPKVRFEGVGRYIKHLKEDTRKGMMEVVESVDWV